MTRPDPQSRSVSADWYEHAFGELYSLIYAHRTVEAAEPEAAFAHKALKLRKKDRLFDLCCGGGRHLVHLAKRVNSAVGLDFSPERLREARTLLGPTAALVRGDMRHIPFSNAFDAATNFFTSFGYFPTDEENLEVLQRLHTALKIGGRYFIDYVNPTQVVSTLRPESVRASGELEIRELRWIDERTRRVNKRTLVKRQNRLVAEFTESVRLYTELEFGMLLGEAGFHITKLFGDYSGAKYTEKSPRMIVVGAK